MTVLIINCKCEIVVDQRNNHYKVQKNRYVYQNIEICRIILVEKERTG